jgi:uncharacterized membrane protein
VSEQSTQGIGGTLPVSLEKLVYITDNPKVTVTYYPQLKYDWYNTSRAFAVDTQPANRHFYDFHGAVQYSPAPYIGAAPAMFAARTARLPALAVFYAGRVGNLLAWIALAGLAIALMPRRKWAFVALALLPMTLFQASTINGDALTAGSLMLFLALILRYREQDGPLNFKQILALLVVAGLMVLSKQVMFIFLPLVLLLGKDKFKTAVRSYLSKAGLIVIPMLLLTGWIMITATISSISAHDARANPAEQKNFIVHNPHSYVNVLWNTYFYTWGDNVTRSFIGVFGWADAPLSELLVTVGYIGLAVLMVATYAEDKTAWLSARRHKYLMWLMALLYVGAVSTSLYLYYTPAHYKIVYGLQGRYFLPAVILITPLLISRSVRVTREFYLRTAVILPVFLLTVAVITTYVRYFVSNV